MFNDRFAERIQTLNPFLAKSSARSCPYSNMYQCHSWCKVGMYSLTYLIVIQLYAKNVCENENDGIFGIVDGGGSYICIDSSDFVKISYPRSIRDEGIHDAMSSYVPSGVPS
jgi:hypothetical protein